MTDLLASDFHNMHLLELPQRLADNRGLRAAIAARELPAICFRINNSDHAYTYCPGAESINIIAGTEAATVITLELVQWRTMIAELSSASNSGASLEAITSSKDITPWYGALKAMFSL